MRLWGNITIIWENTRFFVVYFPRRVCTYSMRYDIADGLAHLLDGMHMKAKYPRKRIKEKQW